MPQVIIKVLGLVPRSQERSLIVVQRFGKGSRFSWQVLEKVLDLGSRSRNRSQFQVLGPRNALDLGPMSQKRSQVQDLRPRKRHRFRSRFLVKVLDLGPRSQKRTQIQVLSPAKGPRFRSQVLDLRPRSYILSKILVLGPRFSQVQKRSQILGPKAFQILVLGSQIYLRLGKVTRLLVLRNVPRFIPW